MADQRDEPERRRFGRRSMLLAGAAATATAGVALGATTGAFPLFTALGNALDGQPGTTDDGITRVERVFSPSRGIEIDLMTVLPTERPAANLPVCLLLHGLHGRARYAVPGGMAAALRKGVTSGTLPPFAFVAVDGGDNYWHENHVGDNVMGMLLDDVPRWLRERRLGGATGTPFGCAGISMGGFGALLYGRKRNERRDPAQVVAAISPGLLTSWREMSTRKAFQDNAQWASLDPLRNVEALGSVPVGIWCGTEDHFIEGARKFIRLAKPEVAYTGPGTHDGAFYESVAPDVLNFVARHVPVAVGKS